MALSPEQTYRPASDAYGEGGQNGNLNPLSVIEQTTDDDDDDVTPTAVKATGKAWTRSMGLDGSSSFDGNSGSDSIHVRLCSGQPDLALTIPTVLGVELRRRILPDGNA